MLTIKPGDCREVLRAMPDQSVHCCVTSPPYFGLRDYGHTGQIGLEPTPDAYVAELVAVFREVRRVLRDDGTLWLNLGDSYGATSGDTFIRGSAGKPAKNPETTKSAMIAASAVAAGKVDRDTGLRPKNLIGIPWRVAFALQADGWYLRQDIIWSKPNPMPESVTDRCTKAHEYIFLMSKQARYFYDAAAIAEEGEKVGTLKHLLGGNGERAGTRQGLRPQNGAAERLVAGCQAVTRSDVGGSSQFRMMRNKRSVWEVATSPYSEAHFATFPPDLIEPCIKAGCPKGGTVLDPFGGAGTTGLVADRLGRNAILIELNPEYAAMTERRIRNDAGMFTEVEVSP